MKKETRQEYFSIPNLMGYFRILLLPVYLYVYFYADSSRDYYLAAGIMALSFLSDFLDGKIARRFHMVTEFGKILDPVADKITHGILFLSFTFRYPKLVFIVEIFLCKELFMAIVGAWMLKKGHRMNGAQWYGKLCTAVLDVTLFLILVIPGLSYFTVNLFVYLCAAVMIFSWLCYVLMYYRMWKYEICKQAVKEKRRRHMGRIVAIVVVFIIVYLAAGAVVPFARHPKIKDETRQAFHKEDYYGDSQTADRAHVISDNGEALEERLRLMEGAKDRIILSTLEFRADISGTHMLSALLAAAQRGVQVSVLTDGIGEMTRMDGNPYFYALAAEPNVEIRSYNPVRIWKPWTIMGRMHDKYLIVDEQAYILGGRNTYDFFLGGQPGYKNYDWDVLVYNTGGTKEGSSIQEIEDYFQQVWELPDCRPFRQGWLTRKTVAVDKARKELENHYQQMKEEHPDWFAQKDYEEICGPVNGIKLISNPTHIWAKEPVAYYNLVSLMKEADSRVVWHTPYIICNDWMLEEIREVCQRVPDTTMMTNSVANNGNPFGSTDYYYRKKQILDTGLQMLEFDGGVSYHGKCLTIDDRLAVVGSFNADMRSAYLDTELMLVVDSPWLNKELTEEMEKYQEKALIVQDAEHSLAPEGMEPRAISKEKQRTMKLLHTFADWARFLM